MDALNDLQRSKRKCRLSKNELNCLNVENENGLCDSSYIQVLQFILKNANKRKTADPGEDSSGKALLQVNEVQPVKRQRQKQKQKQSQSPRKLKGKLTEEQLVKREKQSQRKLKGKLTEEQPVKKAAGTSSREPYQRAQKGVQRMKTPKQVKFEGLNEDQPVKRKRILQIGQKVEKDVEMCTPVPEKQGGRAQGQTPEKVNKRKTADPGGDSSGKALVQVNEVQPVKRQQLVKKAAGTSSRKPYQRAQKGVLRMKTPKQVKFKGLNEDQPEKQGGRAQGQTPKQAKLMEDEVVKLNKILQLEEKEEGTQADGVITPVSEDQCGRAQNKTPTIRTGTEDEPVKKKNIIQVEVNLEGKKAGTSTNPLPEEPKVIDLEEEYVDLAEPSSQPNPKNKGSSVNPEADMSNPAAKDPPSQGKFPQLIKIEDDNDDLYTPSGPKDKGKSVAFEPPIFFSPFLPSGTYYENPFNDGGKNLAFRDEVLKVQRKPFNLEEYSRLQEAVIAGSYLDHFEDLKRLLLSQYKREKRLAILRGFFFWLQNSTRKGAFKPWNDCVCLDVDPPHVG